MNRDLVTGDTGAKVKALTWGPPEAQLSRIHQQQSPEPPQVRTSLQAGPAVWCWDGSRSTPGRVEG